MTTTLKRTIAAVIALLVLCVFDLTLRAQSLPPEWDFPTAFNAWSFFDTTNWTSDKGILPVTFTNITGALRGDINTDDALVIDATNNVPARLQYNVVETNGFTNLTVNTGAITFWFAPNSWASASTNGSGPGAWAELFSVGQWTTNASRGYWGLSLDPGGTNIYFASQNGTGSNAVYIFAPIAWNTNDWHFIEVSYSATNTALYLDGFLATNGPGLTVLPGTNAITNGFFVGSDSTGFAQSRGLFDDIYTYGSPISADDAVNIYYSQFYEFFLNPYNPHDYENPNPWATNGSSLMVNIASISNNLAGLLVMNTSPDVLYEIQATTNLARPDWTSEGFFYGSELTNWTPATVSGLLPGNLFLRTRSWQDSTGSGIPDWWWYQYFGQITNVDAGASAAGDGYNNFEKFQMGLNPTNYYNTNPPSGFFGSVAQTTNVFLFWNPSPGPVVNYLVQRGILNTNTGIYAFTSSVLSSNVTQFEDVGVVTNDNAQNNIYNLEALYAGGCVTGTDTWHVADSALARFGSPWGPPMASNVWAYADASGTNLLISWTLAQGSLTNYIIERGIYNSTNDDYDFFPISVVSTGTNSVQILNEFTNAARWNDIYAVVAAYPSGVLSLPALSTIEAGSPNGPAALTNFSGYIDSTGTNVWLTWSLSTNAISYIVYRGIWNFDVGAYGYTQVAAVGGGTNTFEGVGGAAVGHSEDVYTVVAVYSGGVLSQASSPWQVSNGSAAPTTLYAYVDSTGTNVILAWSTPNPGATGYVLSRSVDGGDSFSQIVQTGSSSSTFQDTNGATMGQSGLSSLGYEIQASYPHGGLSAPSWASVASTPPAPTELSAVVDSTGTNVLLSWQAALGPVSNYTVKRGTYNPTTGTYSYTDVGTTTGTSFEDFGAFNGGNDNNDIFEVQANDVGGQSSFPNLSHVKVTLTPSHANLSIAAQLIRNEQGRWQLMFSAIPTNVQTIVFSWYDLDNWQDGYGGPRDPGQPFDAGTYIPVAEITNGVYPLSDDMMTNWFGNNGFTKVAMVQAIGADGTYGNLSEAGFESYDSPVFVDARIHMKQNLFYELRAASLTLPNISLAEEYGFGGDNSYGSFDVSPSNTDYVESSIFHWSMMSRGTGFPSEYVKMDNTWPIVANYELHVGLYDTNDPGQSVFQWQPQGGPETFTFQGPLTNNPAPPVLGIGDPYWISQAIDIETPFDPTTGLPLGEPQLFSDLPLSCDGVNLHYGSGAKNLFGLDFDTALIRATPATVVDPGSSIAITNVDFFDSQVADPILVLTNYYFAPVITPGTAQPIGGALLEPCPLPCLSGFSNTNQTGVMIASVGTPTVIGGWAKFAISNGSPTKFAYLGQYFTNAFMLTNGTMTTNTTGILSPYGEFFPTEPGVAALVTMPDIDTGQYGTGIVRVVSLNVDANHNGTMDFTYNSPDFVSQAKPFRFWVNDGSDNGDFGGSAIPGQGAQGNASLRINGQWVIHGRRDLVNFFPVYLNIGTLFQSNAFGSNISVTDTNWQFVLSQGDGVLRFAYTDLTPTNYMNFLRDTNESGSLADAPLTTITNVVDGGVPLSQSFIAGIATNNEGIILVEAAAPTTQPLFLTIYHGTNQVVQTQLPLSISGVEQMFRYKNLLLNSNATSLPERLTDAEVPNEPDTIGKNILFVHGYNVDPYHARGWFAETYKRLYWSGSQAKYYGVNWYGSETYLPLFGVSLDYYSNVKNAFLTAPLLANFIATLTNGATCIAGHSLGNMVVSSTIVDYGANVDKYFALNVAVAMEAYDGSIQDTTMVNPNAGNTFQGWPEYDQRLWSTEWYKLFSSSDGRSGLTWRNRFGAIPNLYNFYSSGEEVLANPTNYPNLPMLGNEWAWATQEMRKGTGLFDLLGALWFVDAHPEAGWALNTAWYIPSDPAHPGSNLRPRYPYEATTNDISDSALRAAPFFRAFNDGNLTGTQGSSEATNSEVRAELLGTGIPALSHAAGANSVAVFGDENVKNFNMSRSGSNPGFEAGWPDGRALQWGTRWLHSDLKNVAYPFTYQLYDKLVELGGLNEN